MERTRKRYRIEVFYRILQLQQTFHQRLGWDNETSSQNNKKNSRFTWNPEYHNELEKLKEALIDNSVLKHPDYSSPFVVDREASDNSLGAVLSNIVDGVEYPAECRRHSE